MWGAITAYIVYSAMLTRHHRSEQSVEHVAVEIVDSASSGQLITSQKVKEMLLKNGIATINTNVEKVDTRAIKEMICNEGFVDDVDIYASYSGTLHIRISQRTPLMRLLVDGYDCYITADGYIFGSPAHAALYVPVVTGDYRPQFRENFEGELKGVLEKIRADVADSLLKALRSVPVGLEVVSAHGAAVLLAACGTRSNEERAAAKSFIATLPEGSLRDRIDDEAGWQLDM